MQAKSTIAVLVLLINGYALSAQQLRNEFKVSYSTLTSQGPYLDYFDNAQLIKSHEKDSEVSGVLTWIIFSALAGKPLPTNSKPGKKHITAIERALDTKAFFSMSFHQFTKGNIAMGGQINYHAFDFKEQLFFSNDTELLFLDQFKMLSLLYTIDFYYVSKPKFQCYSGAKVGVQLGLDNDFKAFTGQATWLGIRIGRKHALFSEYGFGLGQFSTLNVGFSKKF